MKAVLQTIRILVITLLVENVRCQDGFSDRDLLRLQQIAANEAQMETITSYSTNIIQRDPSSQSMSSVSVQYHMTDEAEKNEDYNRADRGRSRKVYRIKNPFQRQLEDDGRQQDSRAGSQDSEPGASNQYASMQYSLPPEEFLQQMRAENQYYQQQQQVSTPAPNLGYTATPQPQYQYSTIAASGFDGGNQQSNQIPQLEPKISNAQVYRSISNSYQFNGPNSYSIDSVQSTPSPLPPYLSTQNTQYLGTPANSYVSSSSPIYLSSQPNIQQYVSSSISNIQTGTPDYNKVTSTIGSNTLNYDNMDQNKKMQIDHYDNSAIGVRYPINVQQQYNDYPTSTVAPSSTPFPDPMRENWQNTMNSVNSLSKSLQEVSLSQYPKYQYNRNNQDGRTDTNTENANSETHRIGNLPSANNVYLNFVQPDYQVLSSLRTRTRDLEQETGQPDYYSHGEYGWKLNDKKPLVSHNVFSPGSFPRYQALNSHPDGVAVSQMSFHMDTGKPHNYDHISKSSPDNLEAQEFAKAAAKAHDNLKRQQLYANEYATNFNINNPLGAASSSNTYYNNHDKQRNKIYSDSSSTNPYSYPNSQSDLITASPYYFTNARENSVDDKPKQPFDHDKALKNIVPIDVSNVVANSENQQKATLESGNRYSLSNYGKDQVEQNLKHNYKSITDAFYQDKNAIYGFNIKPKPDEITSPDGFKLMDANAGYYSKQITQEQLYSTPTFSENKQYNDVSGPPTHYLSQTQASNNYPDSVQSSANVQQQGIQRPQAQYPTDITSILKLNDIPYRLTQGLPSESFRSYNNNYEQIGLPTPLPIRLNQNVGSHQLDVTANLLNKLMLNKQPHLNRPEIDSQSGGLISTINGFKVANPFNVDLKLVAEMLKGKPHVEESQIIGLREQYSKPAPLKIDISQLQQLLMRNENNGNMAFNDGFGAYSSPYLDIYNSGRYPYQGVKYSRSQEEEESIIPIADSSNNHPIGAVIEQDDPAHGQEVNAGTDVTAQEDDSLTDTNGYKDDKHKQKFSSGHRGIGSRQRHPNSLLPGRHLHARKYPKGDITEPYPLLKPPPPQSPRGRSIHKLEKHSRRRRVRRPKVLRLLKTEPLFETESEENLEADIPMVLRPPHIAEAKSDGVNEKQSS